MTRAAGTEARIEQAERLEVEAAARSWEPYPEYEESGIDGVGALPAHWRVKPLKRVVAINPEDLADATDPDYELEYVDIGNVSLVEGITGSELYRFEDAPSRARRRVRHGDTVISTVRTYLKAVARISNPPGNLIVSTGFAVLRPDDELDPGFLYRLVQAEEFVGRVVAHSTGVSYPAIAPTQMGRLGVWLPPPSEQRAIAAFLDRKTRQIDALIEKKRRLIDLLQEKRTALISHAVIKGLNPDGPMKPTDNDWLGDEMPASWEVKRLKHIVPGITVGIVVTPSKYYEPSGIPCLRSLNISSGRVTTDALVFIGEDANELHQKSKIFEGDIVVVRTGQTGTAAIVPPEFDGANCIDLLIIRKSTQVLPAFLHYFINSASAVTQVAAHSVGSIQSHYNTGTVAELYVPLPPPAEQHSIVDHLNAASATIEALVDAVELAVAQLTEYRQALISAAVTGKIDVREEAEA